ncbi:MAG: DEAD/DEAH box helicase [Candidatus Cloacimonetes bacterium]|nr:DEAD/DEAH box helicase [Candidatus Cloacimonadota bacterium]
MESQTDITEWRVNENQIVFTHNNKILQISSKLITRIEFKGIQEFEGIPVHKKPSTDLPQLKINRFPLTIKLKLYMPSKPNQKPYLIIMLYNQSIYHEYDQFFNSDQIILSAQWFPLIPEETSELITLMRQCDIEKLGQISIKQALDLIKIYSENIEIDYLDPLSKTNDSLSTPFSVYSDALATAGFKAILYPYQEIGVTWLINMANEGLGCILADEMGLGKTLQVIASLTFHKQSWGGISLIIAPATLLENWKREFKKFSTNITVLIHQGSQRTGFPKKLKKYDVIITSYDTAVRDQSMLGMLNWKYIILDEAQAIKNSYTSRSKAVKSLKKKIGIAVSGTPIENRIHDLWSIMNFTCPEILGSKAEFESKYENDVASATILEKIVSPLILRREVASVAKDLPKKIIIPQPVDIDDYEMIEYEHLRQEVKKYYGTSATLVSLIKLRQFCTHPAVLKGSEETPILKHSKYRRLIEILEEIVSNQEKVIIFTSYSKMIDLIVTDIPERINIPCLYIDGRTSIIDRQTIVDSFSQIEGSGVLVLNPRAAGTGLNITAANHVIHYNLEWNPAIEDQATARAYRRGQELPVTVHRLFYPNTVEEIINQRLERKRLVAEAAIVGTESAEIEAADIFKSLEISPIKLESKNER